MNNILYYKICNFLAKLYCNSKLYLKFTQPVLDFKKDIKRLYDINNNPSWNEIMYICNKKKYNIINLKYKVKLINEYISNEKFNSIHK